MNLPEGFLRSFKNHLEKNIFRPNPLSVMFKHWEELKVRIEELSRDKMIGLLATLIKDFRPIRMWTTKCYEHNKIICLHCLEFSTMKMKKRRKGKPLKCPKCGKKMRRFE